MGKLRRNYSKSFQQVQDRFTGEAGKLFEKEHQGRECTNAIFIRVLFCALCHIQSLFAVCRNLHKCPDDRTVAVAILKTLPEYDKFQKRINEVLAEGLPKNLQRGKQRLAIDLVLIPYHGLPQHSESEIYRSQPKSGTSHFHAYATCCVIKKGFRYTGALTPVTKGEEMKVVLQRLLKQCKDIGIKCGLLLVDRGFYSVSVISYLKHAQVPFMMPVVIRGIKATKNTPAAGRVRKRPKKMAGDKGCSSKNNRDGLRKRGITPVIAYKSNEKGASRPFDTETYKKRNVIERLFGHLKECRRVATRYEKLAVRYHAFLKIACVRYLLTKL